VGRAEKRKAERMARLADHKTKTLMSREDISKIKEDVTDRVSKYNVEAMMSCFALAQHELYGHGYSRIMKSLQFIDDLMGRVNDGDFTIEDIKKELVDKTGVRIEC